jgi:regulator of protease activity HflC (stomatin/prohibitin superfamily)
MAKKENNSNPNTWPKLYSAQVSHWQDAKRIISFMLVFIGILAIIIAYLSIYTAIYPNQPAVQDSLETTGFLISLIKRISVYLLILMITISVGLGSVFFSAQKFLKALYNPPGNSKLLQQIFVRLFGIPPLLRYPFVIINIDDSITGKFKLTDHPSHWLGGPALLIVFDGTGIYLQRGNCFSRTLGPGVHFLERFETVREIVDLRLQTMNSNNSETPSIAGRTKDGIKIKCDVEISFRVIPPDTKKPYKENDEKTKAEIYAEEKYKTKAAINSGKLESIRKAVERTSVRKKSEKEYSETKLSDTVWGSVSGELAKYITKHSLDDLLFFEDKDDGWSRAHQVGANSKMKTGLGANANSKAGQLLSEQEREKIRQHLDKSLRQTTGVTLTDLRIVDFNLPPGVIEQRQEMFKVEAQCRKKRTKGEADAKKILIREKARTRAQQNLIASLAKSLSEVEPTHFADAVMLSLSGAHSQDMDDTQKSTFFAQDTLDFLDQLHGFLNQEEQSPDDNPVD